MVSKKKNEQLTPLELEIMKVLWEIGPATVQMVQQKLERKLAYTTVQTMLNLLHTKGKVKRTIKNRAYNYHPTVTRKKAIGEMVGDLIDRVFGGSAEGLVMSLLETKHITPEKLSELNKAIADSKEKKSEKEKK
jgi:BlaI family transcriptional regulator, penicillinase repressor